MTTPDDRSRNLLLDDDDVDVMNVRLASSKARLTNPLFVASDGVEALRMLTARKSRSRCGKLRRRWPRLGC